MMLAGLYAVRNPNDSNAPYFVPCLVAEDSLGNKFAFCFLHTGETYAESFDESKFKQFESPEVKPNES